MVRLSPPLPGLPAELLGVGPSLPPGAVLLLLPSSLDPPTAKKHLKSIATNHQRTKKTKSVCLLPTRGSPAQTGGCGLIRSSTIGQGPQKSTLGAECTQCIRAG